MSDRPHVMPQGSQPGPIARRSCPDMSRSPVATSMTAVVTKLAIWGGGAVGDDTRFSKLDVPEGRDNAG